MTPQSLAELERVKAECQSIVNKRAVLAAAGAVVPIPGVDIVVDVGLLAGMIPEISKKFGLTKEQVDELDEASKLFVIEMVRQTGAKLVARNVTRETLTALLHKVGVRSTSKRVGKFIPVVGSLISGGIGFAAMKYLGNSHIDECYEVAKRILERREKAAQAAAVVPQRQAATAVPPSEPPKSEASAKPAARSAANPALKPRKPAAKTPARKPAGTKPKAAAKTPAKPAAKAGNAVSKSAKKPAAPKPAAKPVAKSTAKPAAKKPVARAASPRKPASRPKAPPKKR